MKTEQPKQENDYTALLQPVGTKQETLEEAAENYSLKYKGEFALDLTIVTCVYSLINLNKNK